MVLQRRKIGTPRAPSRSALQAGGGAANRQDLFSAKARLLLERSPIWMFATAPAAPKNELLVQFTTFVRRAQRLGVLGVSICQTTTRRTPFLNTGTVKFTRKPKRHPESLR